MENYYWLLNLPTGSSAEEIEQRCLKLGQAVRPDAHGADMAALKQFEAIERAYKTLCNATDRAAYDEILFRKIKEQTTVWSAFLLSIVCAVFIYFICISVFNLGDVHTTRLVAALLFSAALAPAVLAYKKDVKHILYICFLLMGCGFIGLLVADSQHRSFEKTHADRVKQIARSAELNREKERVNEVAKEY
jgi:cell division protein FtsL